jgi:hypothetical protein
VGDEQRTMFERVFQGMDVNDDRSVSLDEFATYLRCADSPIRDGTIVWHWSTMVVQLRRRAELACDLQCVRWYAWLDIASAAVCGEQGQGGGATLSHHNRRHLGRCTGGR